MKARYLGILLLAAAAMVAPHPAAAAGESVDNLAVTARLDRANSLDITEHIDYNFAGAAPHDLSRNLPLSYQDDQGRQYRTSLHLLGATQNGQPITIGHTTDPATAHLTIPTGSGVPSYELHYTLTPVALKGDTGDVLKFSATGLAWPVPIDHITLTLQTPGLAADNLTCYTGSGSSTTGNCAINQAGDTATVTTSAPLPPGDSLVFYCNFPSKTFTTYLKPYQPPTSWRATALWIAAPALLALGLVIWLMYRRRKSYILKRNEDTDA
jgi:hypothetical protein